MKSAYDLALERMESEGIDPPREEAFSDDVLRKMEEARTRAVAKIAELEILHRKKMAEIFDPEAAREQDRNYRAERERIESRRDRELQQLRTG